jgi:choline dehydrogenase-like flavoprotein
MSSDRFDLVVIGSGFGSLFFVEGYLRKRPSARVLILERGAFHPHAWQLQHERNSAIAPQDTYRSPKDHKLWNFNIAVGGGTNCWMAQTPRLHPNDFRTRSLYGVAQDWPMSYEELEPYYIRAEERMAVAGAPEMAALLPRSQPFPQPAHAMTTVDKLMQRAQPEFHVPMACARASVATHTRGRCCASARCSLCPVNAKFTFENGFADMRERANVEIRSGCEVTQLTIANDVCTGVVYRHDDRQHEVAGELVVLGANAIHSPAILLRSGVDHPFTGVGIHEQVGYGLEVMLNGVDSLDGGTLTTALNYSLYDGAFRSDYAGALIYFDNRWPFGLRKEYGRWRQLASLVVVVEDLPQDGNRVTLDADGMPFVSHASSSSYAQRGVEQSRAAMERVLSPLPVESIEFRGMRATESHVQGSLRMGQDVATSVVDEKQVHHRVRNLVVVGSSVFPSGACANPSLTVAALSLRSADFLA